MTNRSANSSSRHPVFEAITTSARRELLRLLLIRDEPVTEQHVAAHLATTQGLTREGAAVDKQILHTDLVHAQLPTLVDAGLITWDRDAATIETAPHPAFDDPRFRLLLEAEADDLNKALSNLAHDRRRILLTILRDFQTVMARKDMAREFLRADETESDADQTMVDDVVVSLHHVHLPALDDAGFIEYDGETGRATYTEHPAVEEVFTIIYEPNDHLADSYDGFFTGLKAGITKLKQEMNTEAEWPHAWRTPDHG